MASSVTRHALISSRSVPDQFEYEYLLCGVDTLDLGLYVKWGNAWNSLQEELEDRKHAAEGSTGILWRTFGPSDSIFYATGKAPQYRYHFKTSLGHIYIGKSEQFTATPNVYASISARSLWLGGIESSYLSLCEIIASLGGTVIHVKPSRCDLCADFLIRGGLSDEFLSTQLISRARQDDARRTAGVLETYYRGAKCSPIQLRIYDKAKEVLSEGKKLWFQNLWYLEQCLDVWRVEFQLRRLTLKIFKVNDLEALLGSLASLWRYLTTEWASVRLLDSPNASRRSIHPWWEAVQNCATMFGTPATLPRYANTRPPDVTQCIARIAGQAISYAALKGIPDLGLALSTLALDIRQTPAAKQFMHRYRQRRVGWGWPAVDVEPQQEFGDSSGQETVPF